MIKARPGRIPLRAAVLFLALPFFQSPAGALSPEKDLQRLNLRQTAIRLEAWNDPYWRKLLHYRKPLLGRPRGPAGNPGFYLARWGDINPRLELEAAVDGLFFEGAPDSSPECRFPERFRWLRGKLNINVSDFPRPECKKLEEWKAALAPESAALVFSDASLGRPSALFGGICLLLHRRAASGEALPDYILSYTSDAEEENDLAYVLKGMAGAYTGKLSFTDARACQVDADRDLREFPLDLTTEEMSRLLSHAWELQGTAFPARFFSRSGTRGLITLLDIARPELDLSHRFRFWITPFDAAKAILRSSGPAEAVWHPSLFRTLQWERAQLGEDDKNFVLELARGDQAAGLAALTAYAPGSKEAVLEASADYLDWLFSEGRIDRAALDNRTAPLLKAETLPGRRAAFTGLQEPPPPLADDRDNLRVGAGLVFLGNGPAYELSARLAAQDLLDPPAGGLKDSALEAGSVRLRYEKLYNRFYIKEGVLGRTRSLKPWDDWTRPLSWELAAGVEQADEAGRQSGRAAILALDAGSGLAVEWRGPVRQLWYAMLIADSGFGPALNSDWRAGAGLKAGLLAEKGPVRALFEARYIGYALGDTRSLWAGSAAVSLRLAKDSEERLEYTWRGKVREAGLYFHQFLPAP